MTRYNDYILLNRKIIKQLKPLLEEMMCLTDKSIKRTKRIGTASINGEVNRIIQCIPECNTIVVKTVPLQDKHFKKVIDDKEATTTKFSEIMFMKMTTELVMRKITPHVPILLGNTICIDHCSFTNKSLEHKIGFACILIFTPKADYDFKTYLKKHITSYNELLNAYFQIFMGLYIVGEKYHIQHHDLHYGNVLVQKLNDNTYFDYKIDSETYTVPAPKLFYLWDFGHAKNEYIIPEEYTYYYPKDEKKKFHDYNRILEMLLPSGSVKFSLFLAFIKENKEKIEKYSKKYSAKQVEEIEIQANVYKVVRSILKTSETPKEIIKKFIKIVSIQPPENAEISYFDTTKKIDIPKNVKILTDSHKSTIKKKINTITILKENMKTILEKINKTFQ
jgi:hypothetical protein